MPGRKHAKTKRTPAHSMSQTRKALKLATPKSSSRRVSDVETRMPYQKSHTRIAKPAYVMKSEVLKYTSNPQKGMPYGERTSVNIKNGHGFKVQQILNKSGKAIKTRKAPLHMTLPQIRPVARVAVLPRAVVPRPAISPGLLTMHRALFL